MRRNRRLRAAVENPYIQTGFHAAGGLGLGFVLAGLIPDRGPAVAVGVVLLAAAVFGHFYAVWSDPGSRDRG